MFRAKATFVAVLALTLALLGVGAPARADEAPRGTITITSITPSRISADDPSETLTISGTFTNTGTVPLVTATAQVWRQTGTLDSITALDEAISKPDPPGSNFAPGQTLATQTAPLAPGASTTFTLTAPMESIDPGRGAVASIVGVDVRAAVENGSTGSAAFTRYLIPHTPRPLVPVTVNLITATPGQTVGRRAVTDQLTAAITGPLLDQLTNAPSNAPTVIDPAVHAAAVTLANDGSGDAQAVAFVEQVERLQREGRLWRVPYGNPNLARLPGDIRAKVAGWANDLVDESIAGAPLVAIVADPADAPEGFDHILTFGGDPTRFYRVDDAASPTALDDLPAPARGLRLPRDKEPWSALDAQIQHLVDRSPTRLDLTTEPGEEEIPASDIRPLILASHSTDHPSQQAAMTYLQGSRIAEFEPGGITFQVSPSFVMGSRKNQFPATITNNTPFSVYVRIAVNSDNPQRIHVPNTDVVEVGAGEAQTVLLEPQASSNGVTRVHAQLESPDGKRFGPVADIEITATELGRVAWIIIIVSGAVVLGGTVWRIRTVRREQASKEASERGQ